MIQISDNKILAVIAGTILLVVSAPVIWHMASYADTATFVERLDYLKQDFDNEEQWSDWTHKRDAPQADYFKPKDAPIMSVEPDTCKWIHPVLHTTPGILLTQEQLTKLDYRRLREFDFGDDFSAVNWRADSWEQGYGLPEMEAVKNFCKLAKGKSINSIVAWIGVPDFVCNDVACWEPLKAGQQRLVYQFGSQAVPVKMLFTDEVCTSADVCGEIEFDDYVRWKFWQIERKSIGQKLSVILARCGKPAHIYQMGGKKSVEIIVHQPDEELIYDGERGFDICLVIKNGVCTHSCSLLTVH